MRHKVPLLVFVAGLLFLLSAVVVWAADAPPIRHAMAQDGDLPDADAGEVLDYILNQNPYTQWGSWTPDRWSDFGGYLQSGEPHGNTVRIFVNEVAREAVAADNFDGTLPPGSLIVKENYAGTPDDPGDLAALSVMYKVEGFNPEANDWFWLQASGDGSTVNAEGAVEGCIACHGQDGNADYLLRYNFGDEPATFYGEPLPDADGAAIMEYVTATSPYTEWASWPSDEVNTEDFSTFLASSEPHGSAVRIFVNDRALDAISRENWGGTLPPGSIIVKENYGGTPDAPGDLAAITLMYKVDGFNPEANDWFWVRASADGATVNAEGAVEGCISCHGQDGNSDYLLRYHLPEPVGAAEVSPQETPPTEEPTPESSSGDSGADTSEDSSSGDKLDNLY